MKNEKPKHMPLYKQLYNSIVDEIYSGKIKDGQMLPSRRSMSEIKRVSPFTVDAAYKLLVDTGYARVKPRKGFFAVNKLSDSNYHNPWQPIEDFKYNFSPNMVDTKNLQNYRFQKIIQETAYSSSTEYLGYGEKGGEQCLRESISDYLYKSKGINVSPERIIIGGSPDYLINALMRALPRDTVYAMADHDKSYYTFNAFDRKVVYFPIDINGIKTDLLAEIDADILYVIPSCQFPLCCVMTPKQKAAILNWAYQKENRYIIEDGYYSDFAGSVPDTLYSMDNSGRVLYIDYFGKTIAPTFKLGYIILPDSIMKLWNTMHGYYYPISPILNQIVLAKYLSGGGYARHLKTMNALYREKREMMTVAVKSMTKYDSKIKLLPFQCGLHILIAVKTDKTEQELRSLAQCRGIKILPLSIWERLSNSFIDEKIFMLGFGGIDKNDIAPGICALDNAWADI